MGRSRNRGACHVEVGTGRVFTTPAVDLSLAGPLPLSFRRTYSSHARERDVGLGYGWRHNHGWEVETRRRGVTVWDGKGTAVDFETPYVGGATWGPRGLLLCREAWGFALYETGLWRLFTEVSGDGRRHLVTSVVDGHGNRIALRYERGRLAFVEDSVGRVVRVLRDGGGRIAALAVPRYEGSAPSEVVRYGYNEAGELATVTDAAGGVSRFTYDGEHRLLSQGRDDALTFHYRYDNEGRCVETWGAMPDGSVPGLVGDAPATLVDGSRARGFLHTKFVYGDDGYREVVDSVGTQRFETNAAGLAEKSVSNGQITQRTFDERGHLSSHVDAAGAVTQWLRDAYGDIVRQIDALGQAVHFDRDEVGRVTGVHDALGRVLSVRHDERGGLVELVAALGDCATVRYDGRGQPVRMVRPDGTAIGIAYDGHGNAVRVENPDGRAWAYRYDYWGRLVAAVEPSGAETRFAWNDRWQPLAEHKPNGDVVTFTYDRAAQCVGIANAERTSRREHNGHGQTTRIVHHDGHAAAFRYDREGFLVEAVNENGEPMRLGHDANGMVTSVRYPDGRELRFRYDAMNRLETYFNGLGEKTRYSYDGLGRVTGVDYPDGAAVALERNARGFLLRATFGPVETAFAPNAGGLVERETQRLFGRSFTLERAFDAMRRVATLRTSLGFEQAFARDAAGRPTRVELGPADVVDIAYDQAGRERARRFSGGGVIETDWDEALPTRLRVRTAAAPARHDVVPPPAVGPLDADVTVCKAYGYGLGKSLQRRWDFVASEAGSGARTTDYAYDARSRLVAKAVDGRAAEVFAHDPADNVSDAAAGGTHYGPGNRLLARGAAQYVWEADARLVERHERAPDGARRSSRYEWDGAGNLARVTTPQGLVAAFDYDAFGRRVRKTVTSPGETGAQVSTTLYVWDDERLVHEVREPSAADAQAPVTVRTYAYDGTAVLAHRTSRLAVDGSAEHGPWVYYVNDVLHTPEQLVRPDGTVVASIDRRAYGRSQAGPGDLETTPLRFPGQYEDEETGLHYNRYRYYDPDAGRYLSADPEEGPPDLNLFRYCRNPIEYSDPLGLHNADVFFENPNGRPPVPKTKLGPLDSGGDNAMLSPAHTTNAHRYEASNNPARDAFNIERFSDTEAKAIRLAEGQFAGNLAGGKLTINGEQPPCRMCRGRMEDFAARNNCNVEYTYPIHGEPKGLFTSAGKGDGVTATSSWMNPPSIPINPAAQPAGKYDPVQGQKHGYAGARPPRPDATPGWKTR